MQADVRKRVVITGASGFLGSHVLAAFRADGHDAIGATRSQRAGFALYESPLDLPSGDILVHAGEPGRIDRETAQGHVQRVTETVDQMLGLGFSRFVYISSAAVYLGGEGLCRYGSPVRDDHPYLAGKLSCEDLVLARGGIVLRLTNLFGQGMSRENVICTILDQIETPGPVRVWDAKPVRDFLHVKDAAAATLRAVDVPTGVYDIGTGQGVSVADIARSAIRTFCDRDKGLVETAPQPTPSRIVVDPAAFRALAGGWRPTRHLLEELSTLFPQDRSAGGR